MIGTGTIVCLFIAAACCFALPIGAVIHWRRTRKARWLPFLVGALTFILFAMVLEPLLHRVCILGDNPVARAIGANPYLYMLYGGLAAGVFEETGRYVALRWVIGKRRCPERDTAVSYGIGHGGIEALLTVGSSLMLLAVLGLLYRSGGAEAALALTGGDRAALDTMLASLGQFTFGSCLLNVLERAAAMLLHIALSIFVFLAVRDRRQWSWFPFAIALHAIADMPAGLYQRGMLPLGVVELWIWVVALYALRSARKCYLELADP